MMVRFYSFFFFLGFSTYFFVSSYTLAESENSVLNDDNWEGKEHYSAQHNWDLNQTVQTDSNNSENENEISKTDTYNEESSEGKAWSSVFTFNRLKNFTERDIRPDNITKVIFINSEESLAIYENDYDGEDETGIQDSDKQSYHLLSPEGFLFQNNLNEENGLKRTKRQAEGGKKKCRCRTRGRRRMRRVRKRRRRVGQARPGRRRRRGRRRGGRRRGKRRCVCRKKGAGGGENGEEDEGKENENPEVEEADGEEEITTTEGGGAEEESDNENEGGKENEDYEDEDRSDESDEGSDEKEGSDEESDEKKGEMPSGDINHEAPVYVISYPSTSGTHGVAPNTAGVPTYTTYPIPFSPYPYYTGSHSTLHERRHHLSKI